MDNKFEDKDHTEFLRLEGTGNEDTTDLVLSRAAFQLHSFGIMNSVKENTPGFISDEYLNDIAAETTLTAMELVSAGLWERSTDGYLVNDPQMLEMVLEATERAKNFFPHEPADCPGHTRGPNSQNRCRLCGVEVNEENHPS